MMEADSPVALVLDRLRGARPSPRTEEGLRRWMARCPCHEDGTPSLQVTEARDGKVLLNCFAGCGIEDVVRTLGLSMQDLFPKGGARTRPSPSRGPAPRRRRIAASYDYRDAGGDVLFQVVRYEPKDFSLT